MLRTGSNVASKSPAGSGSGSQGPLSFPFSSDSSQDDSKEFDRKNRGSRVITDDDAQHQKTRIEKSNLVMLGPTGSGNLARF